jgi:hypothetical protein
MKTVSIPVRRNAHHSQLPATPLFRTMSVTKFGVSVEKVVATIEMPSSHQGICLPARKNSALFEPARFEKIIPTARITMRKTMTIDQSIQFSAIKYILRLFEQALRLLFSKLRRLQYNFSGFYFNPEQERIEEIVFTYLSGIYFPS